MATLLLLFALLRTIAAAPTPLNATLFTPSLSLASTRAIDPSSITATILSETSPISPSLFGAIAPTPAPSSAFADGVHPRVIVGAAEWDALLSRYADPATYDTVGSWSRYHRLYTLGKGPNSPFIASMVALHDHPDLQLYTGDVSDLSSLSAAQRAEILPLAERALEVDELHSASFFMCALWASVSQKKAEEYGESERFLPTDAIETCIKAAVAWAKVLLAHRAYHCNPSCPTSTDGRGNIWDSDHKWEIKNDWYTGGLGLGLTFDVLYANMTVEQRRTIRSALALLVMKRFSWGNSETSDRDSPNAVLHPHRIFSNWAIYHSNLYLANLAIEGETDFDVYASAVLAAEGETGFNSGLDTRFTAMIEAFLAHSFYPDGSTFEDGYSYFIALREGSLALAAAHRRGVDTLDTPRFRNMVHNAAQLYEPWKCGKLIGHSSGGGNSYPAHMALFRYAYPDGSLPNMLWRQRMGPTFKNNDPCRIEWFQNMVQLSFLGGEHGSVTDAQSPEGLSDSHKAHIPNSFYSTRRGLLIARNSLSENSILLHFDARPDAFFPGHDNADRGIFTFTAFKKTWIDDLEWRENIDSRRHSLMHVDGLAQDEKAPSVKMLKVTDDGAVVLASADLTYAYNVQWARNWPSSSPPTVYVVTYAPDGTSSKVSTTFTDPEFGDPRDFGWPSGDLGGDLGFERAQSNMHGDPDIGFQGMWTWKRDYRTTPLDWGVRSSALVRSDESSAPGYVLITDSFQMSGTAGNHVFESYLILGDDVDVDGPASSCTSNTCKIVLESASSTEQVDLHVITLGTMLSYRTETFDGNKRVIVKSEEMQAEEFWMGVNPHSGSDNGFSMTRRNNGVVSVMYGSALEERFFKISEATHDLELTSDDPTGPMAPIALDYKVGKQITEAEMSDNIDEFLHETTAKYQVVLKIKSVTPRRRSKGDRLRTCYTYTNTPTDMAIYDCGTAAVADINYANKACTRVEETNPSDSCNVFMTSFVRRLTKGHPYFVTVSVDPPTGVLDPKFRIMHSRGTVLI